MAQFKDLVVNGAARILGKSYASTFVGPLDGMASSAAHDKDGNDITDYVRGLSINDGRIVVTKGDGSTVDGDVTAASATHADSASTATNDADGNTISEYIKGIAISNATMTLTKGNGSTESITIDAALSASSATVAGSASSATYDSNNNNISSYVKNVSTNNNTLTLTRGDGSTFSQSINNVPNASSATYASSATKDSQGNTLSNYIHSVSVTNATMTLTRGDGSTFSQSIANASSAVAGVSKIYASTGSNVDGSMSQDAVSSLISSMDTELRTMIRTISGFTIEIPSDGQLPVTGEEGILYFIPREDPESENDLYEEYLWVTIPGEGGDPDESYFELIGMTAAYFGDYYTKAQVDTTTNSLVKSISISNGTMTITKGNNSTAGITIDMASSATTATNAGTATHANNASSADFASSATTATNAGTATYATNASSATTATNAGTATYATNAGTAANATNSTNASSANYASTASLASSATTATNAGTSTYATNAGTATRATSAGSASSASTCTNAGTATRINANSTATNALLSACLFDYGWEG